MLWVGIGAIVILNRRVNRGQEVLASTYPGGPLERGGRPHRPFCKIPLSRPWLERAVAPTVRLEKHSRFAPSCTWVPTD